MKRAVNFVGQVFVYVPAMLKIFIFLTSLKGFTEYEKKVEVVVRAFVLRDVVEEIFFRNKTT